MLIFCEKINRDGQADFYMKKINKDCHVDFLR